MNVIVNGCVLSLVYATLMFLWGLLSIPWLTRRFWLTLMFYTIFVILVKYAFQFEEIDWPITENSGLYWPHVLGVEKRNGFLSNVVWDIMLLISLFFHRSLLIVRTCLLVELCVLILRDCPAGSHSMKSLTQTAYWNSVIISCTSGKMGIFKKKRY